MEKEFCEFRVKTKENPEGMDCAAHMAEARIFQCPYNAEDLKYDQKKEEFYVGKMVEGKEEKCIDFLGPKEFCKHQMKIEKNPHILDCTNNLAKTFPCKYIFKDIKYDKEKEEFYVSRKVEGKEMVCVGFGLKSELEEELTKRLTTE